MEIVEPVEVVEIVIVEILVPSEPQQGMLHQGTNRDGEVFPVASGCQPLSGLSG